MFFDDVCIPLLHQPNEDVFERDIVDPLALEQVEMCIGFE